MQKVIELFDVKSPYLSLVLLIAGITWLSIRMDKQDEKYEILINKVIVMTIETSKVNTELTTAVEAQTAAINKLYDAK